MAVAVRLPEVPPGCPDQDGLGRVGGQIGSQPGRRQDGTCYASEAVRRGAVETWRIDNVRASMPHPMHIHGFQFRVLDRRGSPAQVRTLAGADGLLPQDLGLLDTVHVWPGESVRIALDFTHPYAGDQDYVFHCHNLEHAEAGMMIRYRVKG